MASNKREPTQKTQPKKGKPVDIPVPKREEVVANLARIAKGRKPKLKPETKQARPAGAEPSELGRPNTGLAAATRRVERSGWRNSRERSRGLTARPTWLQS